MTLRHLVCAALAALPLVAAGAGALDSSFGTAGRASFDLTPTPQQGEHGSGVAIRSDGKLIVVSETRDVSPTRVVVSRHHANGSVDTAFGSNGRVVLDFGACGSCAVSSPSFELLDNGAIVVAASEAVSTVSSSTSVSNIAVTRLTSGGSVDATFGAAGVARVNPTGHSVVYDLAVQADGRILLAGATGPSGLLLVPGLPPALAAARWMVARLTATGSIDTTFVDTAASSPDLAPPSAAQRIAVQSSGRIVVVGKAAQRLRGYRYSAQGASERAFTTPIEGDFTDLAIDALDRTWALAAGSSGSDLIRFTPQLEVDASYPLPALPRDSYLVSIVPLANGEAFLAGGRGFVAPQGAGLSTGGMVLKLDNLGRIDSRFGDAGRMTVDRLLVNRLALQPDGRLVAAGAEDRPNADGGLRMALARIDPSAPAFVATEWLGFPIQSLGTRSAPQTVTVSNSTAAARTVTVTGTGNFEVQGCGGPLAAGASCQLSITHRPTSAAMAFGSMDFASSPLVISDGGGRQATLQLRTGAENSLVQHYYRSILRRDAEPGGWSFWNAEARRIRADLDSLSGANGTSTGEAWFAMAMSFFGSREYGLPAREVDAYVTDLYRTFFDRAPDAPGLSFWRDQVAQGLPREVILNAFMFSSEFTAFNALYFGGAATRPEVDLVMDMYRGLLGRLPDTAGLQYWVPRMQRAQCQGAAAVQAEADAISGGFAGSSEYVARGRDNTRYVADLYNAFLRRASDAPGFGYWKSALDNGSLSREGARAAFLASAEFNARVQRVIAAGCRPGA